MKDICTQIFHESEFPFMYHMLLNPKKITNVSYIKAVALFSEYPAVTFIFRALQRTKDDKILNCNVGIISSLNLIMNTNLIC